MANVLDLLHPLAQPAMNGFDLSQKHVYGSAPGRYDAPLFVETVPKDKFQIDIAALMRTMTLNTSAFLRGKVTFDFYFVPYSQLWHPFNQFIGQRNDSHSALQKGLKFVPVVHLYDLLKLVRMVYLETASSLPDSPLPYYLQDIHGIPWYDNIWNLLDFFGYGNFLPLKNTIEHDGEEDSDFLLMIEKYRGKYVNVFRPAAYQHIWYDYVRNKFYDNYEVEQALFMSDYVKFFNFDDITCDTFGNSVIPINTTTLSAAENLRVIGLFTQRYVQYKQDLIQSVLPSQQFGAVSDVQIEIPTLNLIGNTGSPEYGTGDNSNVLGVDGNPANGDLLADEGDVFAGGSLALIQSHHTHRVDDAYTDVGIAKFDVFALKRAEALQKWRQNAMRAGNMVDDSFRAHFGVTPRYEADNNALKLGSFDGSLSINTVETTAISAESGNNKVGDLGASATCVINGRQLQFECRDYGVIVCTQYFRPESEYSSCMIDRANTLHEPFDFFSPEFCNIGLNPVEFRDFNFMDNKLGTIIGFASQYWWYKLALDKSHGEFAKFDFDFYNSGSLEHYTFKGDSVMWNAPRQVDMLVSRDLSACRSKSSFYVSPSVLDDVFGVKYYTSSENVWDKLQNQLIFNVYFDIKAIRPMTRVGLPNF